VEENVMKMERKIITSLLSLALLLVPTITKVEASDAGNTKATSKEISVNKTYSDVLGWDEDVDWFKVNVPDDGYFNIQFGIDKNVSSDQLQYGFKYTVYKDQTELKGYTNITSDFTSVKLPYKKGTYYIKVEAHYSGRAPTDCPYTIRVNNSKSSVWEKEGNDSKSEATAIKVNTTYNGILNHDDDVDWYKVAIPNNGYFNIQFGINENVSADDIEYGFKYTVYKDQTVLKEYYNITSDFTSVKLPYKKGTYYIKVEAHYSGRAPTDCPYTIRVNNSKSAVWEDEFNNSKKTAKTVSLNKKYNGILNQDEDVDWYKLTTTKNGNFKLKFSVDSTLTPDDIDYGWKITVYKGNTEVYSDVYTTSSTSSLIAFKKGTYYIKVEANYSGRAPTDCQYSITLKNQVTDISKSSISGLNSYVYTGKNIKPASFKVKYNGQTLTKGKDYKITKYTNNKKIGVAKITIQGLGNFKGTKVISFNITPAKVKGVKVKYNNSKITISYNKVSQASGYQIAYCGYDSWLGSGDVKYTKTTKTKKVVSKVSYYSTYRVQVRAYKKVGKKTIYGPWSDVKQN
jgi:hypothetical protein